MSIDRAKALKAAQKYLAKGQIDRAITEYEQIVAVDGGEARSLLKLGDLYSRQGDSAKAAAAYRKVAAQYAEQGFFLKAVSIYKQILKIDGNDLRAIEGLAAMYEMLTLVSDALATYEQLADACVRAARPDKAMSALGKITELDPENVAAWVRYAEALSRADRIDDAVDAFCRAADLLKRQGRIDDYIKVSERLLFHTHEHVDRARELAGLYIDRGQAKAALSHLQTCFKSDPKDLATLALLARAFSALDQGKKAAAVYREMARVHADAGRPEEEANSLRTLLKLDPSDVPAQQRLASLSGQVRRAAALAQDEDELTEEDGDMLVVDEESSVSQVRSSVPAPHGPEEQALIARLLAECEVFVRYGLRDKIIAQLTRVLELDPHHIEAREKLKDAHVKRGETPQAVAQLLRLSEIVAADAVMARAYVAEAAALQPGDEALAARLTALRATAALQEQEEDAVLIVDDDESTNDPDDTAGLSETSSDSTMGTASEESFASLLDQDDEPELVLEQEEADDGDEPELELELELEEAHGEPFDDTDGEGEFVAAKLPDAVREALEEAVFYVAQELVDEAREALNDALGEYPDHPVLLARLATLDAGAPAEPAAESANAQDAELLQAGVASAAFAAQIELESASGSQGPLGLQQALRQFREGVKRQVDVADTATHYDLGIAYMEMGLYAEAIEAFTLCLAAPEMDCTAHTMIGLSHVAKGDMARGITHFKQSLASPRCTAEEALGLWFEIGNASELQGKASEALVWYEKVEEQNPSFRDVSTRIERLGFAKSPQQEGDEFDQMFENLILKE